MVECVLTWIREQFWLSVTLQNEPFCALLFIVVHFQPVVKLLQKGVRVHHRRVILMQKMQNFSGEGDTPSPHPTPLGASILTPPILKFCLRYWFSVV